MATLEDKYLAERGRVFLTGTQALVRLPIEQRIRDARLGKNTAGFISGYRGSPLGAYDAQLWAAQKHLEAHDILFRPGVNEDLAATSLWGSQQTGLFAGARYDGVFGIWYGKGPGVDRSLDALRHANLAGTSPWGGVVMLCGDDHGAVSSTNAHQTEFDLQAVGIPVLHPASVREYLEFGLLAFALSRYAGLWMGMKCVTQVVESAATVTLPGPDHGYATPDFAMPKGGVHIRLPDPYLEAERRLMDIKLPAAIAFAAANRIDRPVFGATAPRFGIVTVGKAYDDVRAALEALGLSDQRCQALGLGVYKVAMPWPLATDGIRGFASAAEELLVVEEKRPLIEPQIKDALYHWDASRRPRVVGKTDQQGSALLPAVGELDPAMLARVIAARLAPFAQGESFAEKLDALAKPPAGLRLPPVLRTPYYCAGCPHNTSTRVPEGSRAGGGIGCHAIVIGMPDRRTRSLTQMGGEGAPWIGQAPFTDEKHIFQNLGDGTYFHSGLLAIRAAVAAGVNITYKILYNDAVAMTGGQPVDGALSVSAMVTQLAGEGVAKIIVVSDQPEKYRTGFDEEVRVFHRDRLDAVQRQLRDIPGCTVLIYDQTCAAEKRRRRKRGTYPQGPRRVFINREICEGCGDCSVQSNCVAIEPVETAFGRKRQINQHSCNMDYSCLKGFCPSFVTLEGASLRKPDLPAGDWQDASALPPPPAWTPHAPWRVMITGIGGTGVVTIGALLGMAAHLDGLEATVLDNAGLSQKNGAVTSQVQIAQAAESLHSVKIGPGESDLLLACDMIVAASPPASASLAAGKTHAVLNSHVTPPGAFQMFNDLDLGSPQLATNLRDLLGDERTHIADADTAARVLLGNAMLANMISLGQAFQAGWLPLSLASLSRAIELNGVAVAANKSAFALGRLAVHDPARFAALLAAHQPSHEPAPETLDAIIAHRAGHLTRYQNQAYAQHYRDLVDRARAAEAAIAPDKQDFALAVARGAAKLMAYKDEYEVARLYSDPAFAASLAATFQGRARPSFQLAPPLLARRDPDTGLPLKRRFGPWIWPALKLLARLKGLRGTAFDPFGLSAERRMERRLAADYIALIDDLSRRLTPANHGMAVRLAKLPDEIKGFGHIKARHAVAAREQWQKLLAKFDALAQNQDDRSAA